MDLATYIDHTCLLISATEEDIRRFTNEAKTRGFNSVCLRPKWLQVASLLYKCSAVIAFPEDFIYCESSADLGAAKNIIGAHDLKSKTSELEKCLEDGALELDPVLHIAGLKTDSLKRELEAYITCINGWLKIQAQIKEIWLKPIFSCELLNDEEIEISVKVFADLVDKFMKNNPESKLKFAYKNSTGFIKASPRSDLHITLANEKLISQIADLLDKYQDKYITIKAAGGIKDKETAMKILEAAKGRLSHIGTSAGLDLC